MSGRTSALVNIITGEAIRVQGVPVSAVTGVRADAVRAALLAPASVIFTNSNKNPSLNRHLIIAYYVIIM